MRRGDATSQETFSDRTACGIPNTIASKFYYDRVTSTASQITAAKESFMHAAVRPYLTAGVALVGAGVVAVSPLAPPMPDIHLPSVRSAAVELAATVAQEVSPIDQWAQVLQTAFANLGALKQGLAADPDPILQQIIANQSANAAILGTAGTAVVTAFTTLGQTLPGALQTALTQLRAGDVTDAVTTATDPVVLLALGLIDAGFTGADAWQAVANTVQNFANVVAAVPKLALGSFLAVTAPLISAINAETATAQAVVDAGAAGDLKGLATALINNPALVTGAFLNGYGDIPLLSLPAGGLLSGPGEIPGITNGLISGLLALRDTIATALEPTTTTAKTAAVSAFASPAALPAAGATTVALTTAPATKAIKAPAAKAASATDPSAAAGATGATTGSAAVQTGNKAVPRATGTGATRSDNAPGAAVSGRTGKSGASAGASSGSGGGGRHRK
jgi:hypothetical protein